MSASSTLFPEEAGLRQEIAATGYDAADPTLHSIYADWLDDHGKDAWRHRRLVECIQAGALLTAWRVMATWEAGISPLALAVCLADLDGVLAADGLEVRFVCGPAAARVVRDHPQVDKADDYPALSAARLLTRYRTEEIRRILVKGAFNTAMLEGESIYVYLDLDALISTLGRLPLPDSD